MFWAAVLFSVFIYFVYASISLRFAMKKTAQFEEQVASVPSGHTARFVFNGYTSMFLCYFQVVVLEYAPDTS